MSSTCKSSSKLVADPLIEVVVVARGNAERENGMSEISRAAAHEIEARENETERANRKRQTEHGAAFEAPVRVGAPHLVRDGKPASAGADLEDRAQGLGPHVP